MFSKSSLKDIVLVFLLTWFVLGTALEVAAHQYFWKDEMLEISTLCQRSWSDILTGNIREAGKAPFYYLLQRAVVQNTHVFDSRILIFYRTISILAAASLVIALYFFIRRRLGKAWAVAAVISLVSQNIFYSFAAQNRPYMLWMLIFFLLVMMTTLLCQKKYDDVSRKEKWFFALTCLAMTSLIAMGIVQIAVAMISCLFCWYFLHPPSKNLKNAVGFVLSIFLVCAAISAYYGFKGVDAFDSRVMQSKYDLIHMMKQGDASLLKMPLRILIPKVPRDAFIGAHLTNILVLIGIFVLFVYWKKQSRLTQQERFVFIFGLTVFAQVLATIPIVVLIAFLHYWFVQRIFLYLMVCQALLAVVGGYAIVNVFRGHGSMTFMKEPSTVNTFFNKFGGAITAGALLVFLGVSLFWHRDLLTGVKGSQNVVKNCPPLHDQLPDDLQLDPSGIVFEENLVFVLNVGKRLDQCGWSKQGAQKVFLWYDSKKNWHLSEQMPEGGLAFTVCGQPVSFEINRNKNRAF